MEEVTGGAQEESTAYFLLPAGGLSQGRFGRKVAGTSQLASSLNLATLKDLVFLHCNTTLSFCCNRKLVPYEIATVVIYNNGILIHFS
jgi:hypothetical protein